MNHVFDLLLPLRQRRPFSGYPLHRKELFNPFFIIGSGRSGNTLLRRILYAHPDLHIPPESYVLGEIIQLFRRYRTMEWQNLVYLILARFEFHPEFETFEISLRPLANLLLDVPEDLCSLALILDSFYKYHAKEKGHECKRWGDKTPLNTFFLDDIVSVFPKAQFIHMLRDGVDVVFSYLEAGRYSDLESAATRWLTSVKAVKNFMRHYPAACLELRYEILVQEPEDTVLQICDFLQIKSSSSIVMSMIDSDRWSPEMGDVPVQKHHAPIMQPISTQSIGKGRRNFSVAQKQLLQRLIGHELVQLGYQPVLP